MLKLETYQKEFADFLIASNALKFGDFTLKSGRKAPYFINAGSFNTGVSMGKLGEFYASHIQRIDIATDIIFGPAYKGIPLAVSTAIALANKFNREVGVTFDRKEEKDHGDKGLFVGNALEDGKNIVIVDDVITAGTTFKRLIPVLKETCALNITGIVVAVDRAEKGSGNLSAVQELQQDLGVSIYPILTIHQLVEYLSEENSSGFILSDAQKKQIANYLAVYGA